MMEFTFYEGATGPEAHCSMDHEALAYWLTQEIKNNVRKIDQVLSQAHELSGGKGTEFELRGAQYSLFLNWDEAVVQDNAFLMDDETALEHEFEIYSSESIARCGIEDFISVLQDWKAFVE